MIVLLGIACLLVGIVILLAYLVDKVINFKGGYQPSEFLCTGIAFVVCGAVFIFLIG